MSEPELLKDFLARLMLGLEEKLSGGRPLDRKRDASTIPTRHPVEGEKLDGEPTS